MKSKFLLLLGVVYCSIFTLTNSVLAQGTAFTYQGRLVTNDVPLNGTYDFTFGLFNAVSGGVQTGVTITDSAVSVTNGAFTVTNDFGAVFNGTPFWLQIGVRSNGVVSFTPLSPRQLLTPTPYAITAENVDGPVASGQLSGTLPNTVFPATLPAGNGQNLTSLNASALANGTVPDARLSANVALLNASQTFSRTNVFASGTGAGRLIVSNSAVGVDTNVFSGLSFQFDSTFGEGALMSSLNSGSSQGSLSFYTKYPLKPVARQVIIDNNGNVALDQGNANNGALNDGTLGSAGLTFGTNSGEGIASKRTAGGDQHGLDFYTAFTRRMSINNAGFVGIGRTNQIASSEYFGIRAPVSNNLGGMYIETAGSGLPFYGYAQNGVAYAYTYLDGSDSNKWKLQAGSSGVMTVTTNGAVGLNTTSPAQALDVNGEYAVIRGVGGEMAYLGGDGANNDVQVGSLKGSVTNVSIYNPSFGLMDTHMRNLFASGASVSGAATIGSDLTVTGVIHQGTGTGTAEAPDRGVITRRINSTVEAAGSVVARNGALTLVRDGTDGGWTINNLANPGSTTIAFTGLTAAGATVNFVTFLTGTAAGGSTVVFTDAQNLISIHGTFGDSFDQGDMTEVTLTRYTGDYYWIGSITTSYNQ